MVYMFVTLEVSQFSGWLKDQASCRGSQAGHTVRGELYTGREAGGVRGRARLQIVEGGSQGGEPRTKNM